MNKDGYTHISLDTLRDMQPLRVIYRKCYI